MFDSDNLRATLQAYIDGDVLARKVVVDLLEDAGDPRRDAMLEEGINWDALAWQLAGTPHPNRPFIPRGSQTPLPTDEAGYLRFLIECARFGSPTRPDIVNAVRNARLRWIQRLFPELMF